MNFAYFDEAQETPDEIDDILIEMYNKIFLSCDEKIDDIQRSRIIACNASADDIINYMHGQRDANREAVIQTTLELL